ncbi:hypothetical protein WN943_020491 [Citrus x changshan-huyou]
MSLCLNLFSLVDMVVSLTELVFVMVQNEEVTILLSGSGSGAGDKHTVMLTIKDKGPLNIEGSASYREVLAPSHEPRPVHQGTSRARQYSPACHTYSGGIMLAVWRELQKENKDFFRAYFHSISPRPFMSKTSSCFINLI